MASTIGIPSTRVSDIFVRERLLRQVQYDQGELYKVQMQLATGRKFELPSEDPVASLRIMDLQRLIERKTQTYSNVQTNTSFLNATDSALMSISDLTSEARGTALSVMGTTATDLQRQTAAQQIGQIIQQMMDAGNQQFRGRYLFAGSRTEVRPYGETSQGSIEYYGNTLNLKSYGDIDLLFDTNVTGNQVFGGISSAVVGSVDVNPALTYDTRLSDLRGGLGISPGSIKISNGAASSIVDISGAETIADLAQLLKDNPPTGSQVEVEVNSTTMRIRLTAGDLSISEVAGGTTANELGILREVGVGTSWVNGRDLDPVLNLTTDISNTFATPATAVVHAPGPDNDLIFTAGTPGALYNNVTISFANTAPAKGTETVTWNGVDALTVGICDGASDASDVIAAVMAEFGAGNIPFKVELDPLDHPDTGRGFVQVTSAVTANGGGVPLDLASGLQIVNDHQTHVISLAAAHTYEDVLNTLNGSGAGVLAEINASKTGINIHSRLSGCDFAIGENGGTTATQLGLRTMTADSALNGLNHGLGVHPFADGSDFTITRADGVEIEVSVNGAEDVQDVLNLINNAANNADHYLTAQLNAFGNGIELIDASPGTSPLVITRNPLSTAAYDLGLIPAGQDEIHIETIKGTAAGDATFGGAPLTNNDLTFAARFPGAYGNVQLIFQDTATADGAYYDAAANTLTFEFTTGVTDANAILGMVTANPTVDALFAASLDFTNDPTNDGTGFIFAQTAAMTGGTSETLSGEDTNPRETEGVFNAMLRLVSAMESNDVLEMQRAVDLLDDAANAMNFAHAELGAREQGLATLQARLDEEDVQLQEALSLEYDVDMVQVVSDLTAKQATFEASLKSMASIFQMSLLDYL